MTSHVKANTMRYTAYLAVVCSAWFILTAIVIHFLKLDLNIINHTLSQYALGQHGIILESGFYCIGIAQLLLGYYFYNLERPLKLEGGLLSLAGVGVIIVAIFPTVADPTNIVAKLPHIIGAIFQFLFFPIALFELQNYIQLRQYRTYTLTTAVLTAILFVATLILFVLSEKIMVFGLGLVEKLNIFAISSWILVMSYKLKNKKIIMFKN